MIIEILISLSASIYFTKKIYDRMNKNKPDMKFYLYTKTTDGKEKFFCNIDNDNFDFYEEQLVLLLQNPIVSERFTNEGITTFIIKSQYKNNIDDYLVINIK